MKIGSYEEAVRYLERFIGKIRYRIDPAYLKHHDPLERMRIFLSLLGSPQEKFKSVLVGGTSGKGSTSYLISHILTTAGYKTGFTVSPHLQKVNERLQINGKSISDTDFTKMLVSMIRIIETMRKIPVGEPSYFEILVAMAFLYFAQQKVDIAVVEVGMGGEFDATNTLCPLIAVLTNVSLDHTNTLGETIQKIARTKVGIIKGSSHPFAEGAGLAHENFLVRNAKKRLSSNLAKSPASVHNENFVGSPRLSLLVVTGVKQSSVIKIVEDRCKEVGAEVARLGKDFVCEIKQESLKGSVFDLIIFSDREKKLNDLTLSLLGDYQVENASLAVETALQLRKFGFKISEENIKKALSTGFFPGRFEIVNIARVPAPTFPATRPAEANSFVRSASAPSANAQVRALGIPSSRITSCNNFQLVLDGAHNPTKMREFLRSLKKIFPKQKKIFIVGFKFDKDIKKMLKEILQVADAIIVTQFKAKTDTAVHASSEALNLKSLILNLKSTIKIVVEEDPERALKIGLKTIQQFNNSAILIVTGSLYLVGEIRNKLW